MDEDYYDDEADMYSGAGSGESHNATNRSKSDPLYLSEVNQRHILRCWVPTASKLSRGKKGTIQRMFTGEPLKNSCNVYVYDQTTKDWKQEYQIRGDPNRRGQLILPPSALTSSSQTIGSVTYTASASHDSSSVFDVFRPFGTDFSYYTVNSYTDNNNNVVPYYPHNQPSGWSGGTWVAGSYAGSTSLGGVSGEWLKIQVSTGMQPTKYRMSNLDRPVDDYATVDTFTILGSNDDSNWTNLGNFTNTIQDPWETYIEGNLTISTTYTYFALVLKTRRTVGWSSGDDEQIDVPTFTLFDTNTSEDFGRSLDGTDNADMVAVGAPGTWFGSISHINGYAYVFTKDSTGNGWSQRGSVLSQQGGFGHSIALSQYDGNILVVGAPFFNTFEEVYSDMPVSEGKVYIYKWNGTNYTLQQTLNSPSGTLSLSPHGTYSLSSWATWKNFYFGYSLGITDIGDKIIVGEPSIRNIWYEPDQRQGGANNSWASDSFQFTGNAHVYHNHTVLDNGTNWTSNVSMTSVIGVTGIGTTYDTHPTKVRWLDALGVSVDINRAGTRISAGAPGSYGTSNAAPHAMSGRIYTLDWDQQDAEWKEMGEIAKHIVAPQANMLLGKTTRFDGSGRRIVSGATGYIDHIEYYKGNVIIFDWNGDQWVSFPNEMVDIRSWNTGSNYWTDYQHKLGESISIDGEGEMVAIGKVEHHYPHGTAPSGGIRPNGWYVPDITYIGGATTTVAGLNSQVDTGMSNIWVYNITQSMVVKGNVTVGGYIQGTGISIGTNDDSSTSNKSIYFGGSKSDNAYELTVIENRVYETEEKAELLLFKGNDNADATGGGTHGPDRIRLKGGQIAFDLSAGYDRTQEDIRAVMHKNAGGGGMFGINTRSPIEAIHADGKIKSTQGFVGKGRELTGLGFNYINKQSDYKFNQAGATQSPTEWGEIVIGGIVMHPSVALTSNTSYGYTVTASRDVANAWKAFGSGSWDLTGYANSSLEGARGRYLGSVERIPGYKGEWIELHMTSRIYLTRLDINANYFYQPRIAYVFGSNDGIEYDFIHDTGDLGAFNFSSGNQTIFTRTPNYVDDDPYDRILIIVNMVSGGQTQQWDHIDIYGNHYGSFTPNVKIDNSGKIGINTTVNQSTPYALDVHGDINMSTGSSFMINGVAQTFGGGGAWTELTTSPAHIYREFHNVGIGTTVPGARLEVRSSGGSNPATNGILVYNNANISNEDSILALQVGGYQGSSSAGDPYISFNAESEGGWSFGMDNSDSNKMKLSTAWNSLSTNTKMTIDTSGKVGIGTSNPTSLLHVDGDMNLTGPLKISGSTGTSGQVLTSSGGSQMTWSVPGGEWESNAQTFPTGPMTHNTSGQNVASASSTNSSSEDPWYAFNHTIGNEGWLCGSSKYNFGVYVSSTYTTYNPGNAVEYGEWIQFEFPAGIAIDEIKIAPRTGHLDKCVGEGRLLGSNNGSSWTNIAFFTGKTYTTGNYTNIKFTAAPSYTHFRLIAYELSGTLSTSNQLSIGEIQFKAVGDTYKAAGKVGIGTTSPQFTLDVNGDINMSTGSNFRINGVAQSFGGGTGSSNVVAWVYNSSAGPPEVTFDQGANGYIAAIGGTTDTDNILTISGSVKIDYGSSNLPGYGSNGDLYVRGDATVNGNATVNGWLSKPSGSFKIDHPLPSMSNTHSLYHSFIEGPKADLIYRGKVNLVNGSASINLDTVSNMTSGTFEALNRDVQCFTTNESDWDAVKGSVSGNTLTISCQNASSTANVSWLVIGERKDKYMLDTPWTDDDGHFIPEKAKST